MTSVISDVLLLLLRIKRTPFDNTHFLEGPLLFGGSNKVGKFFVQTF